MAKLDYLNGVFLRDYYPLMKAVSLISEKINGFDLDDLLHLGATDVIPISYHIPEFHSLGAFIEVGESKCLDSILDRMRDGDEIDELRLDDFTVMLNLYKDDFTGEKTIGPYKIQIGSDNLSDLICANICGVWDISSYGIELFERYGKANTSDLGWLYPSTLDESSFIALIAHENRQVELSDLVITSETINSICGDIKQNRVRRVAPSIFDGSHTKEYHAAKRESVLKAAIYMKVNHPELCINNTKWAEAISDNAYKFWGDGETPLSIKSISELLGKALSLK
ncbi:MAG: hypothetical protein ACRC1V_05710 [Plesiomonas sp.]